MAIYNTYVGVEAVSRNAYEVEMRFINPVTSDEQTRTRTLYAIDPEHHYGIEDQAFGDLAIYLLSSGGELEGYYLATAVVRRVDLIFYKQSPAT